MKITWSLWSKDSTLSSLIHNFPDRVKWLTRMSNWKLKNLSYCYLFVSIWKISTSVIDLKEMKHLMNVNSEITEIPTCAAYNVYINRTVNEFVSSPCKQYEYRREVKVHFKPKRAWYHHSYFYFICISSHFHGKH